MGIHDTGCRCILCRMDEEIDECLYGYREKCVPVAKLEAALAERDAEAKRVMNTHCFLDKHKGTMVIHYDDTPCPLCAALTGCDRLREQLDRLRREITIKDACLERKNKELDALHYVWCNGGCEGGVHRWQGEPLTLEIVEEAERNTKRLRQWWESRHARQESEVKE